MNDKMGERNMWIVKPSDTNCGKGIRIFEDHLKSMFKYMESEYKKEKNNNNKDIFVVQKYIERPLLMHK